MILALDSLHQTLAIISSWWADSRPSFRDLEHLARTQELAYMSMVALASLLRMNCSLMIPLPCLMRTFSTHCPMASTALQVRAADSERFGWTCSASELPDPIPTTPFPLLATSPKTTPKLLMGWLMAFWSSLRWPPAYWIPTRATNRRRMSLVPSKILKILRSLITFSRPRDLVNPFPPRIWIASSVTNQAASDAKILEMAASSW